MFLRPVGLYRSACFGILFLSILCTCCSHFFWYCFIRIHNITAKAALKFGSESWVLKKREEQRLEAAQMKFLRHLLGITKLNKEKNQHIRERTGAQNTVKEMKQLST
jgi:hypothetical protein